MGKWDAFPRGPGAGSQLLRSRITPKGTGAVTKVPVTKPQPVTKVVTKVAPVTKLPTSGRVCQAEGCGVLIAMRSGRPAAYCSTACRMRAFRLLREAAHG